MGPQQHVRLLSEHVINKIAAGEVVERPASVVKELVENAFDAAATQIDVEIAVGGRKLVAVRDNGTGMRRDDALLCLERHATSKISDVDDIERIDTLGFRGEALAAIASVSRFRLTTCHSGENVGTEITVTGGKITDVRDAGCPQGTSMEARDLFFNVPARRKFLRSSQTELSHVRSCFITQALAHPETGMSLAVDGRESYRLASNSALEDRLRDLFGADYALQLRPVQHMQSDVTVSGFVGIPSLSRSDRAEQFIFVNGRATAAPVIGYAVREGYRTLLPADRNPCVFLFVSVCPGQVDVNVHPTKKEVRFRRSGEVRDAVIAAIRNALGSPAGQREGGAEPAPAPPPAALGPTPATNAELQIADMPLARAFRYPKMPALAPGARGQEPGLAGAFPDMTPGARGLGEGTSAGRTTETAGAEPTGGDDAAPWAWCRVIGQIGGLYVVMEIEDGYVLMDPHAAHERVLFERLIRQVSEGSVPVQALLIPQSVELSPGDAEQVRRNLTTLKGMGFGVSDFGGDAFVIDALPACLGSARAGTLLVELAASLERSGARGAKGRWREESIAQAACKSAVKARDRLTLEEIEQLVIDLARTEMPYTCPHGRPTLIYTSYRELNKKFGRE